MQIHQVSPDLALAGQLSLADIDALAAHGFKTLINNRPDGEGPDQVPSSEVAAKAQALGLSYHYLPLVAGQAPGVELAAAFKQAMEASPKPILAYCRSGNRSGQIFQLAMTLP